MSQTEYELLRFSSDTDSTLGALHKIVEGNPAFVCFTLEDEHRDVKVPGETRIPAGRYQIILREQGGSVNPKYAARFDFHQGMLWLQDVPNFTWIYLHCGESDDHTDGCILTGDWARQNVTTAGRLKNSAAAYQRLYLDMLEELLAGKEVWLTIKDYA